MIFFSKLMLFVCAGLFSCKGKPVQIIFTSDQKDAATILTATKIYKLKKKSIFSDFDYAKLKNFDDSIQDTSDIRPVFEPVGGNFIYYQFMATFKGESFRETEETFHDILIIKTNQSNAIIDAYQYTLEWAEPPLDLDLYKINARDLQLTDNFDITLLNLTRTNYWNEEDELSKENGMIKLN